MAFDKESTGFTFLFAIIMVVVVGTILAVAFMGLKPFQKENVRQEKMKNILMAVKVMDGSSDMTEAPALFEKIVTERMWLNGKGEVVSTKTGPIDPLDKEDAFNVDVRKEYKSLVKPVVNRNKKNPEAALVELQGLGNQVHYPIFKCSVEGKTYFVMPVVGTGLWGPIWGFVGLEENMTTVYAAVFDHKTETPGLGAEINTADFQSQFPGRKIFESGGVFHPITVVKNGHGDEYAVDGITGGTITSVGVGEMLTRTFTLYQPYIEENKQ